MNVKHFLPTFSHAEQKKHFAKIKIGALIENFDSKVEIEMSTKLLFLNK